MTIGLRLTRAFAAVVLIIAIGAVVMTLQFAGVVRETKRILAIDDRLMEVSELERELELLERTIMELAAREDPLALSAAMHSSRTQLSQHLAGTLRAFHESGATAPDTLRTSTASVFDELDAVERLTQVSDWQAIRLRAKIQLSDIFGQIVAVVNEIRSGVFGDRDRALAEVEAGRERAQRVLAATALSSLVASLLLGFQVTRSITRPLKQLKQAAHQLAASDFHVALEIRSKDELAEVGRDLMAAARHLAASYSALKRSNQNLEQFAYAVSHDLREPLRTMSSFSRLLEHRYAPVLTGNGTEYLEFINSAAAHMEQLIDGILEYSRLTSSDHHGFEPLDLTRIINTVLTNLHVSIEETGASVTYDAMPTISGNPAQMIQVFQNLIGNAIKYRREGVHPRIHVAARQESDFWIFSVTDNGIGIDPKDRDSIFGVFQQLHGRSAGGAGIGLAVAKRIVEQHGGTIRVESDGDTGSRFLFSVPKLRSQR